MPRKFSPSLRRWEWGWGICLWSPCHASDAPLASLSCRTWTHLLLLAKNKHVWKAFTRTGWLTCPLWGPGLLPSNPPGCGYSLKPGIDHKLYGATDSPKSLWKRYVCLIYLHQKGSRGILVWKLVEIILATDEVELGGVIVALHQPHQHHQHQADDTSFHHDGKLDNELYLSPLAALFLYAILSDLSFFCLYFSCHLPPPHHHQHNHLVCHGKPSPWVKVIIRGKSP